MSNSTGRARTQEERQRFPMRVDVTAAECKAEKFSGIRKVEFDGSFEIWVFGVIRVTVTERALQLNPNALSEAIEELIQL